MRRSAIFDATPLLALLLASSVAEGGDRFSIDLAERHDLRFLGADGEDELGVQACFGDLDGDGYDEIILGAWLADGEGNERARSGEVYVYFGRPEEISGAGSLGASVIYGAAEGERIGSAAAAGDANGDGITDLLIGARYANGPADSLRPRCGEAFLLLGGSDGSRMETIDLRERPDLVITGRDEGDRLGRRIGVADLDGDGKEDLLLGAVGSKGEEGDRRDAGALFILYGDRRENLEGILDLSLSDLPVLYGADDADALGGIIVAGDWNGDGATDLVLGCGFADGPANSRTNGGETFVLFGEGASRFAGERTVTEGTDFTVYGAEPYDGAGIAAGLGDFDGDGIDDLVIGASLADGPGEARENGGEIYVLFGGRAVSSGGALDLAIDADLTIVGAAEGDQTGSILHVFDWNGDGHDDIIASSLYNDGPGGRRPDAGMIYAVPGARQAGLTPRIDLARNEAIVRLLGPSARDRIATLLTDGVFGAERCLLAGTMLGDGPGDERRDAGEIYILRWKPGGIE